jgi:hypothetical protein
VGELITGKIIEPQKKKCQQQFEVTIVACKKIANTSRILTGRRAKKIGLDFDG